MQEKVQEPWFRKQTWSWYVELSDGKQFRLGKHPDSTAPRKGRNGWKPPQSIMERWLAVITEGVPSPDPTVQALCGEFLASIVVGKSTLSWYQTFLRGFAKTLGDRKASQLTEADVRRWLDGHPWGPSTRRSAITILKRLYGWAVRSKRLAEDPIAHMERPPAQRRERILSEAERDEILSFYAEGDPFRDFLIALMESGARPGEVMRVESKDVDLEAGIWTLNHHKTRHKTNKPRIIYLTDVLMRLSRTLMERHPEGPIFRNSEGNPWNRNSINCRFRRKRRRKNNPIDPKISAYSYRHTWATDALQNEIPIATVAELLGHTSTQMVSAHYSKLSERREYLSQAAERAKGGLKTPPKKT